MYNASNMKSLEETIVDDADSDAAPYHNQNKDMEYRRHSYVLKEKIAVLFVVFFRQWEGAVM